MKLLERYRWRARTDCDWGTPDPKPYRGHIWREEFEYRGEAKRRWAVSIDGRNDVFHSEYWESKHRAIEKAQEAAGSYPFPAANGCDRATDDAAMGGMTGPRPGPRSISPIQTDTRAISAA